MENQFIKAIKNESTLNGSMTFTENGAVARNTTGDALVDLFGSIGGMRSRVEQVDQKLEKAWRENPLLTVKTIFYCRNIRGGLGERDVARAALRWLAKNHCEVAIKNMENILFYGRGDDFYCLIGTPAEEAMWEFIRTQLGEDLVNVREHKPISLLGKWLKSANSHSPKTKKLGQKTAHELGLTERQYRKMLTFLRQYSNVVEPKLTANHWNEIDFEAVPAGAMKKYRGAFCRHDEDRFKQFLSDVESGHAEIKASTLYPYDLVRQYIYGEGFYYRRDKKNPIDRVIEAQWKALPNYVEGENNFLVMADVSGSMTVDACRPLAASVGLAIYFAERNQGPFANTYMTFSSNPNFITLNPEDSLSEKVYHTLREGGLSTNLERAFNKILEVAKQGIDPGDMPKALIVISDMEINPYMRGAGCDFTTEMEKRFNELGYEMPNIVFWQVEGRDEVFHASASNPKVQFCSGSSAATFKSLINSLGYSAFELVYRTLSDPLYDRVKV